MDVGVVSSDDVIASYQQQLSDAHHRIAVLEASLAKALKFLNGQPGQAADQAEGEE